ncbi:hypothetical protein [Serratia liquefaciens]|uniref:hypothetical protein n=1 Tax=Serratia liquefaciens TaxID=614 RepID=UPI000358485D|nr:hypothetical protein [Serratia liquefaciens]AGQ30855.1 hypothetical protein M495_10470 [Serratia liquefaciens ATCC 27592]CAI0846094.1 Uncharacterised protein [Serratia liquefaciens]CAI2078262.1 Uncharacterised protein [Serratia liquefaciens]CAI2447159.1 Uncharacterised protein [Serratia liquefaciens]HBL6728969.1 hypothetical protein [Serratia liquefaciens]
MNNQAILSDFDFNDAAQDALDFLDEIISSDLENASTILRVVLDPNKLENWDKAVELYEAIRQDTSDVAKIAENIQKPESVVSRVKEHIFYKKHRIVINDIDEYRRLDADPEIVNSWSRMTEGDHVDEDEKLFRHEQLESIIVMRKDVSQTEAHRTTIACGYTWNPEEAYNGDISNC